MDKTMTKKQLRLSDMPPHLQEYWLEHKGRLPPTRVIDAVDDPELKERGITKIEVWDYGPNWETDPEIIRHLKRTITIHEHFVDGGVSSIHLMATPSTVATASPGADNPVQLA